MSAVDLWALSNGVGGAAFAVLAVWLAASARGRAAGGSLIFACSVNAIWSLLLAFALKLGVSGPVLDVAETVRDGAWLFFLVSLVPGAGVKGVIGALRATALILPLLLLVFLGVRSLAVHGADPNTHRSIVFAAGACAMALLGLVLIEQSYRAAGFDKRWGLKYICLGVAALLAYDFLMYSYALLYQRIDIVFWDGRGALNALVAPLIAVSVGRNPTWSPRLRLSHQAAFHTSVVIASGCYLTFIALAGYYIRNFGGSWSEFLGAFFLVAMSLLLLVVLMSGQVQARIKVLVRKHLFQYRYDYRAEWLGLTRRLSHADEASDPYQRSIRAVAHILEIPAGALFLLREEAYVCVSHWNMPAAVEITEPRTTQFAQFLRESRWIIDLDEYERNPDHYNGLSLPAWRDELARTRLMIPLFFEGDLLGFMVLAVPRAQYKLTWEDLDLLKTLGSQVGGFLGQQESNQALAQARQFEAVNRLTAFLMHDLKNIAAQQSLIVQNARKHKHNPDFVDDMIMTVDSSVTRLKRLLDQLQNSSAREDNSRRVEVGAILRDVIATLGDRLPKARLDVGADKAFVRVDPERFAMIVGHVIRNAQEATPEEGRVEVNLRLADSTVRIEVADTGTGMSPAFLRESLFKPFFSTKSTRGMGIGAHQARSFVRGAGGEVDVISQPGQGTRFTLVLPLAEERNTAETPVKVTAVES